MKKLLLALDFIFKRKGIDDFFEVARKMKDVKFIWFGYLNKILTTSYILKAIKHKPDNVILPGYIKGNIIKGAFSYASCMFFPTHEETEGIVALEALATNLTLVTRDIGVYEGWLENNVNCYKGKTNEEFVSLIRKAIDEDNTSIHEEGYKVVEERTLKKVGKQLKDEYTELLNKK
ncbi:MAG: glycosyltransferase [Bacillales bacterium]|nr:glycosyltransferase [Bacillales bacterium]